MIYNYMWQFERSFDLTARIITIALKILLISTNYDVYARSTNQFLPRVAGMKSLLTHNAN